jgi:hypothetical protein
MVIFHSYVNLPEGISIGWLSMPVSLSEGSHEVGEMRAMRQILHEICRINQLNLGKVWGVERCPNGKNTVKHGQHHGKTCRVLQGQTRDF